MIIVKIFQNRNNKIQGFSVKGHSHVAPRGKDVVCAGVSALTQSACQGIIKYLGLSTNYFISSGFLKFSVRNPNNESEAILQSMLIGIKNIQEICPKEIKIVFEREK